MAPRFHTSPHDPSPGPCGPPNFTFHAPLRPPDFTFHAPLRPPRLHISRPLRPPRFHISRPLRPPQISHFTSPCGLPPKFHISRAPATPRFHISRAPAASQASHFTPAPPPQISHFTPAPPPPRFHISRPLRPPPPKFHISRPPPASPPDFTFHVPPRPPIFHISRLPGPESGPLTPQDSWRRYERLTSACLRRRVGGLGEGRDAALLERAAAQNTVSKQKPFTNPTSAGSRRRSRRSRSAPGRRRGARGSREGRGGARHSRLQEGWGQQQGTPEHTTDKTSQPQNPLPANLQTLNLCGARRSDYLPCVRAVCVCACCLPWMW